tara:strand:- start:23619 stop:23966 length:348 start_codon:yes stop_codon:yes gene_type:complete
MGNLSKNFSTQEFECSCCGETKINLDLVNLLQEMRDELEESIVITSSYRCPEHNAEVGGAKKSQHLLGTAADIVVRSCSPDYIYQYLDNKFPDKYGVGKYKTFVHIDVRDKKARW